MEFNTFDLHPQVAAGVTAARYITPTPIQEQAIPAVMPGHDVMGLAHTGTGKTAAFVLPILHRLMQAAPAHVRALVLAPTSELAEQTNEAIAPWEDGADSRALRSTAGSVSILRSPPCAAPRSSSPVPAGCLTTSVKARSTCRSWRRGSTRPTRCSTWASSPTSAASSRRC